MKANNNYYVGFRIEAPKSLVDIKKIRKICKADSSLFVSNSKIGKTILCGMHDDLLLAKHEEDALSDKSAFCLMIDFGNNIGAVKRVVKIVNVLADDCIFVEKVSTFIMGNSTLNNLPELLPLQNALDLICVSIPYFKENAYIYAPDARI